MENPLDLLIVDGGLVYDEAGEPVMVSGAAAIVQDIGHALRESGAVELLVGEDGPKELALGRITEVVDDDLRVTPGSVKSVGPDASGNLKITAKLMSGEPVTI